MKEEKTTKESKQVNFRIDPDSAEAFRQFCTSHGMNQAQGFDHLMQILELNNAKATPGRIVEIENFERLLKEILSAYINSIELSSNAELRVQEHFRSDLKRKDQTIDELREQIKLMETEKKDSDTATTALREEQKHLQEQAQYAIEQMEAAKKAASDREEMNRILQLQNQELQQKLVRYDALKEAEKQAQKEAAVLQLKIRELQQTLEHETGQKKNLEQIATQAQQQVREMENQRLEDRILLADLKRQLSDKDSDTQAMLKQVRMQAELEQERAVIAKEREMQEELRQADRETVRLQAELEQLQLQLTRESTPEQHTKQISEMPDTGITADAAAQNTGRE